MSHLLPPCFLQEEEGEEEDIDEGDATDYEDDTANGVSGAMAIGAKEDSQGVSRLHICFSCSRLTSALALGSTVAGRGWAD